MLIRKVSVAALSAALILATTPSFACTGISLKAADGAAIRGRTLEFGFPMQSKVLVVPAGKEFSGTLPDGGKGLTFTSRYAFIGANALGLPAILDGLNDQGLSVGLFYFPGYAKYTPVTAENKSRAIAPQEFGVWALAKLATVDEVREAVKNIVLVPTPAPGLGSPQRAVAGTHFFLQDKSGKSIVVEPVDGTLKVHDAPLGVMTNAPTYDWHMTNLANCINLSPKDVEQEKLGGTTLSAFGSGSGMLGLPGDFTPPSRFVRAAMFSQAAVPNQTAEDAVLAAFHILNQFDIPKGSVINAAVGEPTPEITEWTSVADLKNLRWYFRTAVDQSIRMVDLKEAVAAAKGEIATIDMETSTQPIENVSANVANPNHAEN
jgi:choloylglycine hydrolase